MKPTIILVGLLSFMTSCTTIKIKERDVFDVKRTIHVDNFDQLPYQVEPTQIHTPDNIYLEAWHIDHPDAQKTVLYFGGNGFVIETSYHIITSILKQDVDLLVFNYRGYGRNEGKPSIDGLKRDALAAYDYLIEKRNLNPQDIILHGHSMGTFMASYTASQRKSSALVLESPITDLDDWSKTVLPWFLRPFLKFEADSALVKNSNLHQVKNLVLPLLIITGKDDNITPPQMAEKLYEHSASPKKYLFVIEDGGHNNLPQLEIYQRTINQFYHSKEERDNLEESFINPSSPHGVSRK